jgi:outer membrane usher protein
VPGNSNIPLDTLRNLGIGVDYDPAMFTVGLTFGIDMMPVKNISVSTSYISRRDRYSLSGSQVLAPAKFSVDIASFPVFSARFHRGRAVDFPVVLAIGGEQPFDLRVGLDFSYQLSQNDPYFTFGSWRGFYDFADKNIRMSFGNIGSGIGSYSGTYVGLAFEKNYSYGTGSAKSNQYERTITLPVRSSVEVIMNERSVFKRELAAGTYRLKDFLFSQGANSIDVIITPVNPMDGESYTIHVDMGYDSRLLARNESCGG